MVEFQGSGSPWAGDRIALSDRVIQYSWLPGTALSLGSAQVPTAGGPTAASGARLVPAPGSQCRTVDPSQPTCTHDLSNDDRAVLPAGDPRLRTQNVIIDLLDGGQRDPAWYSATSQPTLVVLRDLRMLARWASACVAQRDVEAHLPADLAARIAGFRTVTDWPNGAYWSSARADPTVDESVVGIVMAVKIMTAKSLPAARTLLRDLMRTATPVGGFPDATPAPVGLSPELRAVCDSAYQPIRAIRKIQRRFHCTAASSLSRPRTAPHLCR